MTQDSWGFPWGNGWPEIDRDGMIEVDRLMIGPYGIALEQMMENAGRALATVAWRRFLAAQNAPRVTVLAGSGGNGGGALTAARRLATWGARVEIVLTGPIGALTPVPSRQYAILVAMGLTATDTPSPGADLILDGLVGYSLNGAPGGRVADLIGRANDAAAPILALDVPSGFDAATGLVAVPAIRAAATVTLALPKRGLGAAAARAVAGDLYLADISVPPALYSRLAPPLSVPAFAQGDILRLA